MTPPSSQSRSRGRASPGAGAPRSAGRRRHAGRRRAAGRVRPGLGHPPRWPADARPIEQDPVRRHNAHRRHRRRLQGHDRCPCADHRHGHHARLESVRIAGRPARRTSARSRCWSRSRSTRAHKADAWIVKIRPGIEFHNGKTVDRRRRHLLAPRIIDPKNPRSARRRSATSTSEASRSSTSRRSGSRSSSPNATFLDELGQYFNAIVPVGYDPAKPVGTGAVHVRELHPRPAERVQAVPQLLAAAASRRSTS